MYGTMYAAMQGVYKKRASIRAKDFDRSAKPTDDFYQFVNGDWLKKTRIPHTENRWGSFLILREENKKKLRAILDELVKDTRAAKGSNVKKLRELYLSGTNTKRINREGIKPLHQLLKLIKNVTKKEELIYLCAHLHRIGVGIFWAVYVDQDNKDSEKMILRLHQDGLGMPDRDYYIKNDKDSRRVREAYKKYIISILRHSGKNIKKARKIQNAVLAVETILAESSMTRVQLRDVGAQYNKKKLSELQKLTPHINWGRYVQLIGVPKISNLVVDQPIFIKVVDTIFNTSPIEDLKEYLSWHLINSYADTLSNEFVTEHFNFYGKIITGAKSLQPRWKRCLALIDAGLGEALGQIYVKKYFPPHAKRKMNILVKNLIDTYEDRITRLDWMSTATKRRAKNKLRSIVCKIGYPEKWKDYSALSINKDVSFAENSMALSRFLFTQEIKKLGKPVDRKEWFMSPQTVNAYYSPSLNNIVFPAGILQPPFFNVDADDAINYGAIGAIIGHELTHGFDDKGSEFDEMGNHKNWWLKMDRKKFNAKAKKLVEQYDAFEIVDGMHVNGKLTLGENIADIGGLVISYHALQKVLRKKRRVKIDGFTPEQRFFISAAIAEKQLTREEFLKFQIRNDPHSPAEFRINGPLSNIEEFYGAFNVRKEDGMYRKKSERIVIW